jgi:hypothetical protein
MLGQADFTLELLPLHLGGDGHATPKDVINLCHLLIAIGVHTMLINSRGAPVAPVLLVVASSSDPGKFCTLLDHALRCGESHTTSLRHRDTEMTSSPFDLRTTCQGIRGLLGPCDHLGQLS